LSRQVGLWIARCIEARAARKEAIVTGERYTREAWQQQYNPIDDWDDMFRRGQWDHLAGKAEIPHYALIAGYAHKLIGRGRVLDAGCGEGVLIDYLDLGRLDYVGFDISETAISRARQRAPSARLLISGIDEFPIDQERPYDAIIFNEVLPAVRDPLATLDRFCGILEPGGVAIISLYQNPDERANAKILTRMLEAELALGRYTVVAKAVATSSEEQMTWNVYCLR
jgi:2-polyprenyl-3-methyl-5-hydroxy-6-metoxy-1,4-benzoquinol methylase